MKKEFRNRYLQKKFKHYAIEFFIRLLALSIFLVVFYYLFNGILDEHDRQTCEIMKEYQKEFTLTEIKRCNLVGIDLTNNK